MTKRNSNREYIKSVDLAVELEKQNQLRAKVYRMRSEGHDWYHIAKTCNISLSEAKRFTSQTAQEIAQLSNEWELREQLEIETSRLDKMQLALWDLAMEGDTRAVDSILRIISMRAKLRGLESVNETSSHATATTVVVANGNDKEYIAALRRVAEQPKEVNGAE